MTSTTVPAGLAFLRSADLEIAPVTTLPDSSLCQLCGESITLMRVYATDQPVWTAHRPFEYAECCLDCGVWCVATAVLQRSYGGSVVLVEVAADVWTARDDEGCC